jgi:hypothetical protein
MHLLPIHRVCVIWRAQVWLKMHLSEQRMDEAAAGRLARLEHRCVLMWQVRPCTYTITP